MFFTYFKNFKLSEKYFCLGNCFFMFFYFFLEYYYQEYLEQISFLYHNLKKALKLSTKMEIFILVVFLFHLFFPHLTLASGIQPDYLIFDQEYSQILVDWGNLIDNGEWEQIQSSVENNQFNHPNSTELLHPRRVFYVVATAYSSSIDECWGDPTITASGKKVFDRLVAANFLPFGAKMRLPEVFGAKMFEVQDRMNARYDKRIDLWMPSKAEAKQFGIRWVKVELY